MKRGRAELTRLSTWGRDPVLHGLLRDWHAVATERRAETGGAWLDQLSDRWSDVGDLFAVADLWTAPPGSKGATVVALSPRGGVCASGHVDGRLRVWDVDARRLTFDVPAHRAAILAVAFHPDGALMATGSADRTVRLWTVETGTLLRTLSGHLDDVEALAFHPGGMLLASASRDGTTVLWEVPGGTRLDGLVKWPPDYVADGRDVHIFPVLSVAFSPDGRTLATGSHRAVVLWDVASRREVARWSEHRGAVAALAFSKDSGLLISGSLDRSVQRVSVTQRRTLPTLPAAAGAVRWLRELDAGETLIGLVSHNALQFWDLVQARVRCVFCPMSEAITGIDYRGEDEMLCCGLESGEIRFLRLVGARGLLREAAGAFRAGRAPATAAGAYELLTDWPAAAQAWLAAGDGISAGQMFARCGEHVRAGSCFRDAGAWQEAATAFVRGGDLLAAAGAWIEAGRVAEAVSILRSLLPAGPDARLAAGWRLAACPGVLPAESEDLARESNRLFHERLQDFSGAQTLTALESLAFYAVSTSREAVLKEGFEAGLRHPRLSAAERTRVLEGYLRAAGKFANESLMSDLEARLMAARTSEQTAARQPRLRSAATGAAPSSPGLEPASIPPEPQERRLVVLWHASANVKCARLLHEALKSFPTEVVVRAGKRLADARRLHTLTGVLAQRHVRGYEVEFTARGELAVEALAAVAKLMAEHSAFHG